MTKMIISLNMIIRESNCSYFSHISHKVDTNIHLHAILTYPSYSIAMVSVHVCTFKLEYAS